MTPERSQPPATIPQLVRFTAGPGRRRLVASVLLGAGAVAAGIGLMGASAWLISRAAQHPNEPALALGIVAVQCFGLSRGLLRYGQRLLSHDAALRALSDLRLRVYARLQLLAPSGLDAFRAGDLLARFIADVEALQDLLIGVIGPFAVAALVGAGTVALLWALLPAAGAILAVALALAAAVPLATERLARRSDARQAAVRGELSASVVDLLDGAPELVANGAADRRLGATETIDSTLGLLARRHATVAGVGRGLATLLPGLAMLGCLVVGIDAVRSGELAVVLLAVVAIVPLATFELTAPLSEAAQRLTAVGGALGRVQRALETPPPVTDPDDPQAIRGPATVRIRGLRCRYDDGPWVLDGIDLELTPGRRVALIGPSGAGKSTLAAALLRFIPYQQGSIELSGVELSRLRGEDCRRAIGLLDQDAHVFNASVAANLRIGRRDAADLDLWAALSDAGLAEWAQTLPDGLETEVGEFGNRLSGGERRRLAAARVMLGGFPVLIADEPGEHLDLDTADALVRDLLSADPSQAVLLITHRLHGLDAVDEILVLEQGRVLERGTHDQLLARGRAYAELFGRESDSRPSNAETSSVAM
jgi:thiol reductant ABC exporter CydC subunit